MGFCLMVGRSVRRCGAQDQVSMLTFFFSSIGLEALDAEGMKRFIVML